MAGNANRWLGIVRDFGFYHASPFGLAGIRRIHGGTAFSARSKSKGTPFVRAKLPLVFALDSEGTLIGGIHLTAGVSGLSAAMTPFAMSAGGGVNL